MNRIKEIENKLHELSKDHQKVSLRKDDKNMLRSNLEAYMESHPLRVEAGDSWFAFLGTKKSNLLALFRGTVAGAVGAVLIGGGVAYAAQDALPGEALYPVKVNFNEEVLSLAAVTAEAEARLQAELAERRIQEVGVLAAKGELSSKEKEVLQARFERHSKASERSLHEIEGENRNKIIAEIQSEFEATLAVHEELLARLATGGSEVAEGYEDLLEEVSIPDDEEGDKENKKNDQETTEATSTEEEGGSTASSTIIAATSTRQATSLQKTDMQRAPMMSVSGSSSSKNSDSEMDELLDWIHEKRNEVSVELEKTESRMWQEVKSQVEILTKDTLVLAQGEIKDASELLEKNKDSLGDAVKAQASSSIAAAKNNVEKGKEQVNKEEYAQAFESFRDATQAALQAQMFVKTGKKLDPFLHIKDFDKDKLDIKLDEKVMVEKGTTGTTGTRSSSTASTTGTIFEGEVGTATDEGQTTEGKNTTATGTHEAEKDGVGLETKIDVGLGVKL